MSTYCDIVKLSKTIAIVPKITTNAPKMTLKDLKKVTSKLTIFVEKIPKAKLTNEEIKMIEMANKLIDQSTTILQKKLKEEDESYQKMNQSDTNGIIDEKQKSTENESIFVDNPEATQRAKQTKLHSLDTLSWDVEFLDLGFRNCQNLTIHLTESDAKTVDETARIERQIIDHFCQKYGFNEPKDYSEYY